MINVNLKEWRKEKNVIERKKFLINLSKVSLLSVAFIFIVNFFYSNQLRIERNATAIIDQEITILNMKINQIQNLNKLKDDLSSRIRSINEIDKMRPLAINKINNIITTLPDDIYIRSFDDNGESISLVGVSSDDVFISEFMRRIESNQLFRTPILRSVVDQDSKRVFNLMFFVNKDD